MRLSYWFIILLLIPALAGCSQSSSSAPQAARDRPESPRRYTRLDLAARGCLKTTYARLILNPPRRYTRFDMAPSGYGFDL